MNTTKLDMYNYSLIRIDGKIRRIDIRINGNNDLDVADIATCINVTDGRIYVEGHYFNFVSMETEHVYLTNQWILKIQVEEIK